MAMRETARLELTERDRFWLRHLERQAAGAETSKAYAGREKLSICALYQARMRLVARGAWPAASASVRKGSRPAAATPVRFTRLALPAPTPVVPACRLRLSSGMVLEWSAPPPVEVLAELVARMASPR
jgi:hypothetical protein